MELTVIFISHIVLCVLISLTNGLICPLVLTTRSLRTPTNSFLLSLAFSDFLTGAVLIPLQLVDPSLPVSPYVAAIVLLSGVGSVCIVTFDRYVAVTKPFSHAFLMKRFARAMLVAMWTAVVVVGVLPVTWRSDPSLLVHKIYLFCVCGGLVMVPFAVVFAANFVIFRRLRKHSKQLRDLNASSSLAHGVAARRTAATEAKLARVMFFIALMFIVAWLPVLYMTLVSSVAVKTDGLIPAALPNISLFTVELSSLINPLVYSFSKPDLKRTFRTLLCFTRSTNLKRTGARRSRVNSNIAKRLEHLMGIWDRSERQTKVTATDKRLTLMTSSV